jgi:hypothetical protein
VSAPERTPLSVVEEADVIEAGIATANPEQLATMLGWLWRMIGLVLMRIAGAGVGREPGGRETAPDRILAAEDVAKFLGRSKSWVYAHQDALRDARVNLPGLKFSERRLERFIERRGG